MFDYHQFAKVLALEGIKPAELARRAGVKAGQTVTRITDGLLRLRFDTAAQLTAAMGISIADVDLSPGAAHPWMRFSWKDSDKLARLFRHLSNADRCLYYSQAMETYLQHKDQFRWVFSRGHRAAGWSDQQVESLLPIFHSRAFAVDPRDRGKSVHFLVTREDWFLRTLCENACWADSTSKLLAELDGKTVLGIVPPNGWQKVDATARKVIAKEIGWRPEWYNIGVADDTLAFIRPTLDHVYVSYYRPRVQAIRTMLEENVGKVPYFFPSGTVQLAALRKSVEDARKYLGAIARHVTFHKETPPELDLPSEKTYWAKLALQE